MPRPDGRKPLRLDYAWQRARQQAGIRDFRFHDLRHSAASYLAMNGASLMEIAVVLGHKTLEMARTDQNGRVKFRLADRGAWLIKAMHVIPAPSGTNADWASFWASLTFELTGHL